MRKEDVVDVGVTTLMKAVPAAPPVTVSLAHIAGYSVADIVLWLTMFYTLTLLVHKLLQIALDARAFLRERRKNLPDHRQDKCERRRSDV